MAIKDFLGHKSLSSTQIYTHLQTKKLKKEFLEGIKSNSSSSKKGGKEKKKKTKKKKKKKKKK